MGQNTVQKRSIKTAQRIVRRREKRNNPFPREHRERNANRSEMFVHAVARPLMEKIKQTTGIVGLDVVPNTREVLIGLYSKTLNKIQKVLEDERYRKLLKALPITGLRFVKRKKIEKKIESRIGCG